jgi:citrate synthase
LYPNVEYGSFNFTSDSCNSYVTLHVIRLANFFTDPSFYSGIIYAAMGFPTDMFPVLFCIARTAG